MYTRCVCVRISNGYDSHIIMIIMIFVHFEVLAQRIDTYIIIIIVSVWITEPIHIECVHERNCFINNLYIII